MTDRRSQPRSLPAGLKQIFGAKAAVIMAVVGLFSGMFAATDALHHRGRGRLRDFDAVRPGPDAALEEVVTACTPAEAIRRVEAAFAERHPTVTHRSDSEIVLFVGKGGGLLQFDGIVNASVEEMPLLVAARAHEGCVNLVVDNDFGWNLFVGPARRAYVSRVKAAVGAAQQIVRLALQ